MQYKVKLKIKKEFFSDELIEADSLEDAKYLAEEEFGFLTTEYTENGPSFEEITVVSVEEDN